MMRGLKLSTIFSLATVLGCSACTAGDKLGKGTPMQNDSDQQELVAGISVAEHTDVASDITFHVSNSSETAVDMLIWNTPLERELSADVFTVTFNGMPMAYQGRMVKRSTPGVDDYLSIAPNERVEAVLDMADFYEMTEPGEYEVSFTPSTIDGQVRLNEQTPVQLDTTTLTLRIAP